MILLVLINYWLLARAELGWTWTANFIIRHHLTLERRSCSMHSWRMKINATTQYLQPTALILLYLLDNVDSCSIYELKTRKSSRLLGFYLQTIFGKSCSSLPSKFLITFSFPLLKGKTICIGKLLFFTFALLF